MTESLKVIPLDMAFYATPPHECSYLPERRAVTLFADPKTPMSQRVYSALAEVGFRRSGEYVYRPRCPNCDACLPARIPVERFRPDRSQRRVAKANHDLSIVEREPGFDDAQYRLYRKYMGTRHAEGGMDVESREQYLAFLTSSWCDSRFVEFHVGDALAAVAVVDVMSDGLSAVYTFFDPDLPRRGLGIQAVLWQIGEARRRGLPYVYLGYYIAESPKMNYKYRYRPLEVYRDGQWRDLTEAEFPTSS